MWRASRVPAVLSTGLSHGSLINPRLGHPHRCTLSRRHTAARRAQPGHAAVQRLQPGDLVQVGERSDAATEAPEPRARTRRTHRAASQLSTTVDGSRRTRAPAHGLDHGMISRAIDRESGQARGRRDPGYRRTCSRPGPGRRTACPRDRPLQCPENRTTRIGGGHEREALSDNTVACPREPGSPGGWSSRPTGERIDDPHAPSDHYSGSPEAHRAWHFIPPTL